MAEDSALTCYLVDEVLNVQPPEVRDLLLRTSILEHVSGSAAIELTGDEQAASILSSLAHSNALVQPIGSGWYRYHTLFAEMLRLRLRYEHPDLMAVLHRRAARWFERNGMLAEAVRHAAAAGDWPLAAALAVDDLAIGQLAEPGDGRPLAAEFARMPAGEDQAAPAPYLVLAAMALAAGQYEACAAAVDAADDLIRSMPADQGTEARLSAALLRLSSCLRTGDLATAAAAVRRAELMLAKVPGAKLARHPEVRRQVLSGRAAVELWSGHADRAAGILEAGLAEAAALAAEPPPGWGEAAAGPSRRRPARTAFEPA